MIRKQHLILSLTIFVILFGAAHVESARAESSAGSTRGSKAPAAPPKEAESTSPYGSIPSGGSPESTSRTPTRPVSPSSSRTEAPSQEANGRLTDRRLEICQQRAGRINDLLDKSTQRSRDHVALFQTITERVEAFAEKRQLSSTEYDIILLTVKQDRAKAESAIGLVEAVDFDCMSVDSQKPGLLVQEVVRAQSQSLKEYREAVKSLIIELKRVISEKDSGVRE